MGRRLTQQAHDAVGGVLRQGDRALDATAGNGHDTLFLARCVGAGGQVLAFDVQPSALDATRRRLAGAGASEQVRLIHDSHAHLRRYAAPDRDANFRAAMFNLGYLPGSARDIVTTGEDSVAGLDATLDLLAPGGLVTVLAYRGHEGGAAEAEAVAAYLAGVDAGIFSIEQTTAPGDGPVLWTIRRSPPPGG